MRKSAKNEKSVSSAAFQPLPEVEGNALRYTAGYMSTPSKATEMWQSCNERGACTLLDGVDKR